MNRSTITAGVLLMIVGGTALVSDNSGLLEEGDHAPDFTATLSTGETISLSDFRNHRAVVLFFYPKNFTAGCTREVCSFRDSYDALLKFNVMLFGVSFDTDSSHQAFAEKYSLPFPLISDADKSISKAYGTAGRLGGLLPGSKRVTYVIDTSGIIRKVLHHELFIGKHVEGVLEALSRIDQALQAGTLKH